MKKTLCLLLAFSLLCAALPALASNNAAALGQPFQDFSVTTIDGDTFTLSKALQEYEAVYLNIFATWCPPCAMEFPFMQTAYEEYGDRVAMIAISIEETDDAATLEQYRKEHSLTLPMAPAGTEWLARYTQASSIPVSLLVDRFGNLALWHVGAITDAASFRSMFDAFLGEIYTKTKTYTSIPQPALSMDFPADEALSAALNAEGSAIAFTSDPARRDYPFLPAERNGQGGAVPANLDKNQTVASVQAAFTAKAGDALTFNVAYDLEPGANYLNVELDGALVKAFNGKSDGRAWAVALTEGEHEISFTYDQWVAQEGEGPFLSNVRLLSGADAEAALAALPVYPAFDVLDVAVTNKGVQHGYFLYMGQPVLAACVVNSDAADIALKVTADADPETVLFLDTAKPDDIFFLSGLLTEDGAGYAYSMNLNGISYAIAAMESLAPRFSIQLLVIPDEAHIQRVIDDYAQRGYALTWVPEEAEEPEETEAAYTVYVVDQNGDPVPGAYINFCTDDSCERTQADENGVITYTAAPYAYHLQILKLPAGYSFDPAFEVYTEAHSSELTVTVTKD
ncbi:MAG: redoxin domain-containing protein [Clostridia bacterium]|nr:redoxin domain-containing protein [Clostridia bacterium]